MKFYAQLNVKIVETVGTDSINSYIFLCFRCNTSSASHRAFSSSSTNELLQNTDTTKTSCSNNEIRLPTNEKQFYNICQQQQQQSLSEMKFHHLNNENMVGGPQIIGSHSDFKGVKPNNIEEKHGLPRPPFVNGNQTPLRNDSLNGTTHNKDGVELQQKKVLITINWNR